MNRFSRLIAENPCRIPGYDKEVSPERPVGTIPQVITLSELIAPRFRALVLLAAFTGLRWGEIVATQRGTKGAAEDDENRTRMTSLEDETLDALARRFPYLQRKRLTAISRQ